MGVSISTKSWRVEDVAGGLVGLAAQPDRLVGRRTAQVEVAVLEPRLLPHVDVVADREGQRCGRAEHLDVGGHDLDRAGLEVGVLVALLAQGHLADDLEAVLRPQLVRDGLVPDHDLDDAAGLTQVDERHAAVVAPVGDPPGQRDRLAGVLGSQRAGVVGADQGAVSCGGGHARPRRWAARVGVALRPQSTSPMTLTQYSLRQLVRDGLVADHDLHDAAGLTQVDERDPAVVAPVRHPAGQRDRLAGVLGTQRAGVVGADQLCLLWWCPAGSGRRAAARRSGCP